MNNFVVDGGVLYRKLLNGTHRRVTAINSGRLVVVHEGARLLATDIAWICHHLVPCPHPTVTVDCNPHNMDIDNVMAVRRRRLVFRPVMSKYGFKHNLNKMHFSTREAAFADWVPKAREQYVADRDWLLASEDYKGVKQQIADAVAASQPRLLARQRKFTPPKRYLKRPPMPDVPEGMECHWYKDQWVVIPKAVHCSDDWMVRAEACLKNPQARFRYDPVLERTVTVDA